MRLRGKDALRFSFTNAAGWKSAVGSGDVLGNVREHIFAALHVFVEKISGELRIKNAGGADGKKHQQQNWNDRYEEPRNDEAIAQTQEQAASSPGDQAIEKIDRGDQP